MSRRTSHVTRPRPILLHLARRFRYRRASEPRPPVARCGGTAARMDVHHPVVERDGRRPARRHRRHRRRLHAAARCRDRRRDHGCQEVRPARMARRPRLEGLGGFPPPPFPPPCFPPPPPPPPSIEREGATPSPFTAPPPAEALETAREAAG